MVLNDRSKRLRKQKNIHFKILFLIGGTISPGKYLRSAVKMLLEAGYSFLKNPVISGLGKEGKLWKNLFYRGRYFIQGERS